MKTREQPERTRREPTRLLVPELLRLWQPACPYQLMHFLWVDNKEPLVEPQGCGHTAGIWLQANNICEDSRGCADGEGVGTEAKEQLEALPV